MAAIQNPFDALANGGASVGAKKSNRRKGGGGGAASAKKPVADAPAAPTPATPAVDVRKTGAMGATMTSVDAQSHLEYAAQQLSAGQERLRLWKDWAGQLGDGAPHVSYTAPDGSIVGFRDVLLSCSCLEISLETVLFSPLQGGNAGSLYTLLSALFKNLGPPDVARPLVDALVALSTATELQKSAGGIIAAPHAQALRAVVAGLRQLALSQAADAAGKGKPRGAQVSENAARLAAMMERLEEVASGKAKVPAVTALREQQRLSSDAAALMGQQLALAGNGPAVPGAVRSQLEVTAAGALSELRAAIAQQARAGAADGGASAAHAAFAQAAQLEQALSAEDSQLQQEEEALQAQVRALEGQMRALQARLGAVQRRRDQMGELVTQQRQSAMDMTQPSAAAQRSRLLQQSVDAQGRGAAALEAALRAALAGLSAAPAAGGKAAPAAATGVTPAAFARAVGIHLSCRLKQLDDIRGTLGDNAQRLRGARGDVARVERQISAGSAGQEQLDRTLKVAADLERRLRDQGKAAREAARAARATLALLEGAAPALRDLPGSREAERMLSAGRAQVDDAEAEAEALAAAAQDAAAGKPIGELMDAAARERALSQRLAELEARLREGEAEGAGGGAGAGERKGRGKGRKGRGGDRAEAAPASAADEPSKAAPALAPAPAPAAAPAAAPAPAPAANPWGKLNAGAAGSAAPAGPSLADALKPAAKTKF